MEHPDPPSSIHLKGRTPLKFSFCSYTFDSESVCWWLGKHVMKCDWWLFDKMKASPSHLWDRGLLFADLKVWCISWRTAVKKSLGMGIICILFHVYFLFFCCWQGKNRKWERFFGRVVAHFFIYRRDFHSCRSKRMLYNRKKSDSSFPVHMGPVFASISTCWHWKSGMIDESLKWDFVCWETRGR